MQVTLELQLDNERNRLARFELTLNMAGLCIGMSAMVSNPHPDPNPNPDPNPDPNPHPHPHSTPHPHQVLRGAMPHDAPTAGMTEGAEACEETTTQVTSS